MIRHILKTKIEFKQEFLFILVFRILLDFAYGHIITKSFDYAGFVNSQTIETTIISWIVFLCSSFFIFIISKSNKPSVFVFHFLYYLSFTPFTTCIQYGLFNPHYIVFAVLFWFFMFAFESVNVLSVTKQTHIVIGGRSTIHKHIFYILAFFSFVITFLVSYKFTGLRLHFNILTVYDLRDEAVNYNISSAMGYFFSWTRVINSFMVVYYYLKDRKELSLLFFFCCLLNFGFDGSKTSLFIPLIALFMAIIHKHFELSIRKAITTSFLLLCVLCIVEHYLLGSFYLCSFFERRMMFVENLNSSYYYDFFSNNSPDYFKGSFLRLFGFRTEYPDLAKTIGFLYSGRDTNANCGLIADAVTNFGVVGFLIYPLIVSILMKVLDGLSYKQNDAVKFFIGLYFGIYLINSFLTTSLLTHGLLVLLILSYCVSYDEAEFIIRYGQEKNCY